MTQWAAPSFQRGEWVPYGHEPIGKDASDKRHEKEHAKGDSQYLAYNSAAAHSLVCKPLQIYDYFANFVELR